MDKYIVVFACRPVNLNNGQFAYSYVCNAIREDVNKQIEKGYEPVGGINIIQVGNGFLGAQSMVLKRAIL